MSERTKNIFFWLSIGGCLAILVPVALLVTVLNTHGMLDTTSISEQEIVREKQWCKDQGYQWGVPQGNKIDKVFCIMEVPKNGQSAGKK